MYKGNDSIAISINDESKQVAINSSVQSVIEMYAEVRGVDIQGIAIALNGEVLPRVRWQTVSCLADDKLEIFSVVAGG
ncbi:sulfur carrier protein ThiS [Shewanella pealeana]|uniref:Thiamine biosynthesis protein ThiS n=1 Tax=Shewanella pealeana (strain ATCC 700345 / ANG-SQ1) TaxID=398579 RepID=A8H563_SHEPA|nr:sulfur carrier protein ThiS [Shewanella pealeana]ABV87700.1 thiamine biosynthesis protein ThiS [Shewanella pealeana ATCC 700345]